ncbi:helix-turn-helix transcriptional regulator [Streptomyces sp. CC208A]|uniref:helix-turn-helix transcriptional regulator n=1 Tax=Streptomyces sp. CC208A TaxID=3044573 RepID=UPI0024A9386B|nr:helix-turn-helix transcriptional regulator [Streptomyces sp. CC208A]
MRTRQFDGKRLRAARRARELSQKDLGAAVGVKGPAVSRWEDGQEFPKGEKLPALAAAVGEPLDALFPADGPADLHLLRCDAGLSITQAAEVINASRVPVSNAEGGRRRLSEAYVKPLAQAYGVTEAELLAAQDVSFGVRPEGSRDGPATPRTIGEKINYLVQHGYVGQEAPSDEEIARLVNEHAGTTAVTTEDIVALREGATTEASDAVRAGLAHALQVNVGLFQDDAELGAEDRQFLESLVFLGSIHRGQILGLAARGNGEGLSAEMMAKINEVVGELRHKLPEAPGSE